jgi:hypothetical protein
MRVHSIRLGILKEVSINPFPAVLFSFKSTPFMGKVMVRMGLRMMAFLLVLASLLFAPVQAASWMDSEVDMGIGVLGIRPESGQAKTVIRGFHEANAEYSETLQQALDGLVFRRQPFETHPAVGKLEFSKDGFPLIKAENESYPLLQSGLPLGDGTMGMIVLQRQGEWVQVVINQAPKVTGWVKITLKNHLGFWLWYHYFASMTQAKTPLVFITPFKSELLYQPNDKSLSQMKHLFQMEDAVMTPLSLEGPYMFVEAGQKAGCKGTAMPQFQKIEPIRAWIRWIQDNGRPRVYRYLPPQCG